MCRGGGSNNGKGVMCQLYVDKEWQKKQRELNHKVARKWKKWKTKDPVVRPCSAPSPKIVRVNLVGTNRRKTVLSANMCTHSTNLGCDTRHPGAKQGVQLPGVDGSASDAYDQGTKPVECTRKRYQEEGK